MLFYSKNAISVYIFYVQLFKVKTKNALQYKILQNILFLLTIIKSRKMIDALQMLGYYSLALIILGTLGNSVIVYVTFKTKPSTLFVLLRYLAVCDTISLYFWNLNIFVYSTFNLDIANFNIYSCKIGDWIQFASLQASAWILVRNFNFNYF